MKKAPNRYTDLKMIYKITSIVNCEGSGVLKMMNTKKQKSKNITTFGEHLDNRYGKIGSKKRTEFEIKAKSFAIGEVIREERRLAKMTQEQLAERTGTRKSFISRIENGHSDIQLSTLYRLIELGLGRKISLTIQ